MAQSVDPAVRPKAPTEEKVLAVAADTWAPTVEEPMTDALPQPMLVATAALLLSNRVSTGLARSPLRP